MELGVHMGVLPISFDLPAEAQVRTKKNMSKYVRNLVLEDMKNDKINPTEMSFYEKAGVLLYDRDKLPKKLVRNLIEFIKGPEGGKS